MSRDPNRRERRSLANAIQLLREATYRDKANVLDDLLQDGDPLFDRIEVDDLEGCLTGAADKLFGVIVVDPRVLPPRRALGRCDPELIELAGTLLHECTHLDCHDELAGWGTEIALYKDLVRRLDDLFDDCDEAARRAIERAARDVLREARATRRRIAERGGPGYGGEKKMPEPEMPEEPPKPPKKFFRDLVPAPPSNPEEAHLAMVGDAVWAYAKKVGEPPAGGNREMVAALLEKDLCPFRPDDLDEEGRVIDYWDRPYVYRTPGEIYRDFDLYSLGPCGKDEGGFGENLLYVTRRR